MSWIWSALMPHPPVLLPEIGRGRENEAAKTLHAIEKMTPLMKKPDLLFILSPHQPYSHGALFVNSAENYHGSFALFGVPEVKIDIASGDNYSLCSFLENSGTNIHKQSFDNLTHDQGTLVPLYFLRKIWGNLPPVIISSPIGLTPEQAFSMGQSMAEFHTDKNLALLASGDLSHRLTPDAPAGYEPDYAPVFEAAVEEAIKICSPEPILALDEITLECAGECGLRSVMAMLGLVGSMPDAKIQIFSHEWPFGVGYCNALWRKS